MRRDLIANGGGRKRVGDLAGKANPENPENSAAGRREAGAPSVDPSEVSALSGFSG